jgi:hypothetical protein
MGETHSKNQNRTRLTRTPLRRREAQRDTAEAALAAAQPPAEADGPDQAGSDDESAASVAAGLEEIAALIRANPAVKLDTVIYRAESPDEVVTIAAALAVTPKWNAGRTRCSVTYTVSRYVSYEAMYIVPGAVRWERAVEAHLAQQERPRKRARRQPGP